jgi:hypothetical protein
VGAEPTAGGGGSSRPAHLRWLAPMHWCRRQLHWLLGSRARGLPVARINGRLRLPAGEYVAVMSRCRGTSTSELDGEPVSTLGVWPPVPTRSPSGRRRNRGIAGRLMARPPPARTMRDDDAAVVRAGATRLEARLSRLRRRASVVRRVEPGYVALRPALLTSRRPRSTRSPNPRRSRAERMVARADRAGRGADAGGWFGSRTRRGAEGRDHPDEEERLAAGTLLARRPGWHDGRRRGRLGPGQRTCEVRRRTEQMESITSALHRRAGRGRHQGADRSVPEPNNPAKITADVGPPTYSSPRGPLRRCGRGRQAHRRIFRGDHGAGERSQRAGIEDGRRQPRRTVSYDWGWVKLVRNIPTSTVPGSSEAPYATTRER